MIIFNLGAVVVGLLTALIAWALSFFMDSTSNVAIWIIASVLSILGDLVGLKPRIFFLPIWAIAIVVAGVESYEKIGALGMAAIVGGVATLMGWTVRSALKKVAAEAEEKLPELESTTLNPAEFEYWELAYGAFDLRLFGSSKPEYVARNLRIVRALQRVPSNIYRPGEIRVLESAAEAFEAPLNGDSELKAAQSEAASAVHDMIKERYEALQPGFWEGVAKAGSSEKEAEGEDSDAEAAAGEGETAVVLLEGRGIAGVDLGVATYETVAGVLGEAGTTQAAGNNGAVNCMFPGGIGAHVD